MLPLKHSHVWRVGGALLLLFVFAAMVTPALGLWPTVSVRSLLHFDKWIHGLTFLVLTLWFSGQYAKRAYWKIAIGLLLFGATIELVQRTLTYRTGDLLDFLANLAGVVAGLAIAFAGVGGWSLKVEGWFATEAAD